MENQLLLGISRKNITPKVGGRLMGYKPDIYSESINDELTVDAYYFEEGETKALLISATLCVVSTNITNALLAEIEEKFHIPKNNVILHAIHTHSGPVLSEAVGWGDPDLEYLEEIFRPMLMAAVDEALRSTVPVTMAIGRGDSLVGINRREIAVNNTIRLGQNPWGPFDPRMTVISFKSGDTVVANFVHYGTHATAAGMNREVTRDWPGPMIDSMEDVFGGQCSFFNGPEGDVGPRMICGKTTGGIKDGVLINHVRYAMQIGAVAAQDAVRITRTVGGYHTPTLAVSHTDIKIPLKPRISLEEATEKYEEFSKYTVNILGKKANYYRTIIESYSNGYKEEEFETVGQTIIKIGEVAFVAFSYELFSEIGMRIARASKIPYTLSLSNTNGVTGYFPTESDLCRGGYEVESFKTRDYQSMVDNADWHLVTGTLEHIDAMLNK